MMFHRMRKRLIDVTPDFYNKGVFYYLQYNTSSASVPWLRSVTHTVLDSFYYLNSSGDKYISPLVSYYLADGEQLSIESQETIASNIKDYYVDKWQKLYNTLFFEYDPISNYDMIEEESIESEHSENVNGTNTDTQTGTDTFGHSGTIGNSNLETITLNKSGSEKETLEFLGSEKDTIKFLGEESNTLTKSGKERTTTEFDGDEVLTKNGEKTTELEYQGQQEEQNNQTETNDNIKDTITEFGFNSVYSDPATITPQNINIKTGALNTEQTRTTIFHERKDTTTETFDNYEERKTFDNQRKDTQTLEFLDERKDVDKKTFNERKDETEKTFQQRKDEKTLEFTQRQDKTTGTTTSTQTFNNTDTNTKNLTSTYIIQNIKGGDDSTTRTLTRKGNIGVTTSQQMIQSERDLLMWDFFNDVVFKDIDKILCLDIY